MMPNAPAARGLARIGNGFDTVITRVRTAVKTIRASKILTHALIKVQPVIRERMQREAAAAAARGAGRRPDPAMARLLQRRQDELANMPADEKAAAEALPEAAEPPPDVGDEKVQHAYEGRPLKCLLDVCTRWGSMFAMLQRALKLRYAIHEALRDNGNGDLNLSDDQWEEVRGICMLLEPFAAAVRELEGERYVTSSLVWYHLVTLKKGLEGVTDEERAAFERSVHRCTAVCVSH